MHLVTVIKLTVIWIPYLLLHLIYSYLKSAYNLLFSGEEKSLLQETILVTGCSTGIGKSLVLKLAKLYGNDITLILWDYNDQALESTASEVKAYSKAVHCYIVDVSDSVKVSEAAAKVKKDVGDVTILINNAGVSYNRGILQLTPDQIEQTLKVNLLAHFWTMKEFLPKMIETNHGHVVATCSIGGLVGMRGNAPYFTSKFALRAAMSGMRTQVRELYPLKTGIHFTTIYPWFVKTPLLNNLRLIVRFPKLMSLLEPDLIAEEILKGIRHNKEDVIIPNKYRAYVWLQRVVPEMVRKKNHEFGILDYQGIDKELELHAPRI